MHRSEIEVVQVELALKCVFVICFEEVEGKGCSRAVEGCRIPAHEDQLPITFVPWNFCIAGTERDAYFMPTVGVDNGEIARCRFQGTWFTVMPKVADESERVESSSIKESILPALRAT